MVMVVSTFYKIPSPTILDTYTFSEIQEMFINVLYYRKQEKEQLENK